MMRHRHLGAVATTLMIAAVAAPRPSVATTTKDEPTSQGDEDSPYIIDIDATILDVEATIVDLDAGTRESTTEKKDEKVVTVTLDASVFFDSDQFVLRPDAQSTLRDVAGQIRRAGTRRVDIAGHTDYRNTNEYNQALSERRASAVRDFLAANLEGVQFDAVGYGETRPIAPNETPDGEPFAEGMALNRRVEITYTPG